MKYFLLLILTVLTFSLNAQTSIVDFEIDDINDPIPDCFPSAEWKNDPNVPLVSLEANPNASGINTTNNSVKYTETMGSGQGNSLQLAFNASTTKTGFSLTTNKYLKFMVYSQNQTDFDVTLHLGNGNVNHFEMTKSISTAVNTWTEVEFDFSGNDPEAIINNAGGWITNIRIHFNNGTAGNGDVFFVDEMVSTPTSTVVTDILTVPASLPIVTPITTNYTVSGSLYKKLDVELTSTTSYANFTLYADNTIIADNLDVSGSGTYTLNSIVKFPSTGSTELKLVATGSDLTVESFNLTDVTNVLFPEYTDETTAAGIIDDPSLKYAGPTIADMDNDGDYDLILNNHNDVPSKLFWNDGDGTFTKNDSDLSLWKLMDLHGSAAGDYDNDGDLDLLMTLGGGNGTNPTPPVFYKNNNGVLERSDAAVGIIEGARGRSPRWADLDYDGDLDLILVNAEGINGSNGEQHIFYENLGDGTFQTKNVAGVEDANGERILLTDLDNDHIDDIVIFSPLSIWKGNGDFTFVDVSTAWLPSNLVGSFAITSMADIDIDNDGDLDLYLTRGQGYFAIANNNSADFFPLTKKLDMRVSGSQGTLPFEVTADNPITLTGFNFVTRNAYAGGFPVYLGSAKQENIIVDKETILEITEAAADGWPASRTENGFYIGHIGNGVWNMEFVRNQDIFWSIHVRLDNITGFTPTGWTPNNRNNQDVLLMNNNQTYTNVSDSWNIPKGGNHWGVTTGDFNNDSFQDIYVYRFGYLNNRLSDYMLLNTGQGKFEITTAHTANNAGASSHGDMGQAFDYNQDGKLDILNGDDEYGIWHMYKNTMSNSNNYVTVNVGYAPNSNIDPLGAEITVTTDNNVFKRRVGSAGEAHSQSLLNIAHFGLGQENHIVEVEVRWRNGEILTILDEGVNQIIDTNTVDPTQITITPSPLEVRVGEDEPLSLEFLPVNANQDVTWSSSDENIATVDSEGNVTGIIEGTVTITATSSVNTVFGIATVNVVAWYAINVESISIIPESANIIAGQIFTLTSEITPANADNQEITWSSSNDAVATVNANGEVTGVTTGTVTITATTTDGNKTDTSEITVTESVSASLAFDDPQIYTSTEYSSGGDLVVTTNYHAGSGFTVVANEYGGIKYWLRHLNSSWVPQNNYLAVDASALGTESGTSTATISLENAIPTADLPSGDFYWLWVTFYTSDGNKKIEVSVANINIVDGALSVIDITEENNLKLYPNPANTHIYVPQNLSNKSFKVLDMKGRKILDIKSDNVGRLNIDFLSTGTYYLINETRIGKFVKK
tara:strand:+ start:29236 stop:33108 length:3873 start_codon:yes stop_codon:yes gene_type:complete